MSIVSKLYISVISSKVADATRNAGVENSCTIVNNVD